MSALLTRDEFREGVFRRDGHKCVICRKPGQDAHHIIERRLFPDGGYYLDNGVTVCGDCHIAAEQTIVGYEVEDMRVAAGITKIVVPPHLYPDERYDKWGNPIMDSGLRLRGELFDDISVQKVLQPVLHQFTSYVKFPRTVHLPNSPGVNDDDRVIESLDDLENSRNIIITEKLDGENTTMYRNYIHARSVNGMNHPSQGWIKNYWSQIAYEIPDGWRICGENMFAKHSIYYPALRSYFYGFSIWNEQNECLPWSDTLEYFDMLGIQPVPLLDIVSGAEMHKIIDVHAKSIEMFNKTHESQMEGFVVRDAGAFSYRLYKRRVAKWVRKGHVQSSQNWRLNWNGERNGIAVR